MRSEVNLKLWIITAVYAVGIVVGARVLPDIDLPTLATIIGTLIVVAISFSLFWAVKQSNPRWGLVYGLLIVVILSAGVMAGLCSKSVIDGDQPAGGGCKVSPTKGKSISSAKISKAENATPKRQASTGYDTEKITVVKAARRHVEDTIAKTISERYRGLMMGIVLGMTEDIPPDIAADFKTTGLSHILAVSGLNISILIIAFGYLVRAATINMGKLGRMLAFTVTASAVVFYMFLTKLQPSVVRAGVMGLAALGAILASRRGNPFPALAAAAMTILVIDPAALFDIGFQLSFAATITILVFTPPLETAFKTRPGGLGSAACLTLAAQLGVAPLLILYFEQLSLVSIASNVMVGPAIAPATIFGILITLAGAISTGLARIMAIIVEPCLAYIVVAANYFAGWPYASVMLPPVSAVCVAAYYGLLGLFYFGLIRYNRWRSARATINDFPNRRFARTATVSILLAVLVVGLFGCQAAKSRPPAGLRAVFIDVGQGDATLIQAEDGATILIDGGPEPDSAVAVLRSYGIRTIDLLIMTHAHADHAGGLEAVVSGYFIKKAVLPDKSSNLNLGRRIIDALEQGGVSNAKGKQGHSYAVGKYMKVSIMSPDEAILNAAEADESDDANNRAVVALIRYKKIKLMFTGDIELSTEQAMVNDQDVDHVEVLKVPHHGSKNGADARFLNAAHPEIAVISVGANNPFHHPAPSTLAKLRQAGAAVYRTDKNGSVIIESNGSTIHVSTTKQ
ncbi:MAG: DNA internalization-related competence protein ComEC/Rec2 [Actinomycetota bacterium]